MASVAKSTVDIVEKKITNGSEMEVTCISLGAAITSIKLPDGTDVVLGFKDLNDYCDNECYIGCSVGRVANRIRDATFSLGGQPYEVSANKHPHTLHGGKDGFNKAEWSVENVERDSVTFSHTSPDEDQGYPGNLVAKVTYTITEDSEVMVKYTATTDKPTIVNLVNHAYFNLAQKGTIHDHMLQICASKYTPLDEKLIAKGCLEDFSKVSHLDFTQPTAVGKRMTEDGYDHNYHVGDSKQFHPRHSKLHLCAVLSEGPRELKVFSDQPGMQLYTGKYLDAPPGSEKAGCPPIKPYAGLCLETQAWPNAINNENTNIQKQVILEPGREYSSTTVWQFKWAC